ncbi:MAG TPA: cellulase family glycosylhydrolase [Candidatus Saccharimonadales bacterium]|nr:cellulase family glycosylhydrolase [Candidatus Saccharimonadales bacterium]
MKNMLLAITSTIALLVAVLPSAPAAAATRRELGIATSTTLPWMNEAMLNERLKEVRGLGAIWLRIDFSWALIQPNSPTEYEWGMYDRMVETVTKHRMKILAVMGYPPSWARDSRCVALTDDDEQAKTCAPRSRHEFGRFVRAVAQRYPRQTMRGWEIWNEPNLNGHWKSVRPDGTLGIDPVAYARLANTAATNIRPHNPDCVILPGGLAPMFEPKPSTGMMQSDYLDKMLPKLRKHLFTGVAVHPYSWPLSPGEPVLYNAFYTVDHGPVKYNLRRTMENAGWGSKEIWGTEYGASTRGLYSATNPNRNHRPDHVSEPRQAEIVGEGIDHWYQKTDAGVLFLYSDSDQWLSFGHQNEKGFGLRRANGSKKPAYNVVQREARQLNQ